MVYSTTKGYRYDVGVFPYIRMALFKKLFGEKDVQVVGVDIGSSSIKVVQLSKNKGTVTLDTYGSLALGPYTKTEIGRSVSASPEILLEAFNDILKESGVTTKSAGVSIPFHSSLISLIELPRTSKGKIAEMITYEARKYVPIPLKEVSLDWFIIPEHLINVERVFEKNKEGEDIKEEEDEPTGRSKMVKVLLIAIHNHQLVRYKKLASSFNLDVGFFEIEVFSTLRSALPRNLFPTLIVDVGAHTTKFYIVESGIIIRSYFINKGGETITNTVATALNISFGEAEELKRDKGMKSENKEAVHAMRLISEEILREANTAMSDFYSRYNKRVGKVLFTGGGAILKGFFEFSKEILNTEPELADTFIDITTPEFMSATLKEIGPEFAVSIGVALRRLEDL